MLDVGARLRGHASCVTRTSSTASEAFASVESTAPVIAILHIESRQCGQDVDQFVSFPTVAQRKDDIPVTYDAQVSMKRIQRIQNYGRRARARQRGSDLVADMPALSHAHNDNLAAAFHGRFDEIHGLFKFGIQTPGHCPHFCKFNFNHLARPGEVIHTLFLKRGRSVSIANKAAGCLTDYISARLILRTNGATRLN